MPNQSPEEVARDVIDAQLEVSGWVVQDKDSIDFKVGRGQAIREYQTDTGPADYVLFLDGKPVGVVEAKKETLGQNITTVEDQTGEYAASLKRAEALRQSILKRAFSGKLVPQNPNGLETVGWTASPSAQARRGRITNPSYVKNYSALRFRSSPLNSVVRKSRTTTLLPHQFLEKIDPIVQGTVPCTVTHCTGYSRRSLKIRGKWPNPEKRPKGVATVGTSFGGEVSSGLPNNTQRAWLRSGALWASSSAIERSGVEENILPWNKLSQLVREFPSIHNWIMILHRLLSPVVVQFQWPPFLADDFCETYRTCKDRLQIRFRIVAAVMRQFYFPFVTAEGSTSQ